MDSNQTHWYALRVYRRPTERLNAFLAENTEEVFVPRRKERTAAGRFGVDIPAGQWHSLEVVEPSVIFETKEGPYIPLTPDNVLHVADD